ncbi:MAG: fatty acid desaturase [Candidatus Sumerlaeia bacterium]|nr:fatty acid desaturase [Candidatus Sumerlaeia bacterium]
MKRLVPGYAWSRPFIWKNAIGIVLFHIAAAVALLHFTWTAFFVFLGLSFLTAQIGISLGFHRLLCHRSFQAHRFMVRAFATLGTLALQAGPITWVTIHRLHHQRADHDGDPHSPNDGRSWAYVIWTMFKQQEVFDEETRQRAARDLCADPVMVFLERHRMALNAAVALALFGIGAALGGMPMAISLFLWGFCVRILYGWHLAFFANMATHIWGYRNFQTPDNSRNLGWLFPFLWGDGLHNNHHADPRSASYACRRFELDALHWVLLGMQRMGLIWGLAARSASR